MIRSDIARTTKVSNFPNLQCCAGKQHQAAKGKDNHVKESRGLQDKSFH
jgi:hypothetical protein